MQHPFRPWKRKEKHAWAAALVSGHGANLKSGPEEGKGYSTCVPPASHPRVPHARPSLDEVPGTAKEVQGVWERPRLAMREQSCRLASRTVLRKCSASCPANLMRLLHSSQAPLIFFPAEPTLFLRFLAAAVLSTAVGAVSESGNWCTPPCPGWFGVPHHPPPISVQAGDP